MENHRQEPKEQNNPDYWQLYTWNYPNFRKTFQKQERKQQGIR